MRSIPLAILALLQAWTVVTAGDSTPYEGLSGIQLADAVRRDFAPKTVFKEIPQGFNPAPWPVAGIRCGLIIPPVWSGEAVFDLYNVMSTDDALEYARADYPLTDVEKTVVSGEGWCAGFGTVEGLTTNVWEPARERRGDIARRIMYIALMYPHDIWEGRAPMLLADGSWPLLTTHCRNLLSRWSEEDPIDERERRESSAIAALQGNENPFVTHPELFSYLWGEHAGDGYVSDDTGERTPLKGVYSREADRMLDLFSPYVPADAVWAVDGERVFEESVSLDSLSLGEHTVSYTSATSRGKVKISVKP